MPKCVDSRVPVGASGRLGLRMEMDFELLEEVYDVEKVEAKGI
jgi:hypothetical protein